MFVAITGRQLFEKYLLVKGSERHVHCGGHEPARARGCYARIDIKDGFWTLTEKGFMGLFTFPEKKPSLYIR